MKLILAIVNKSDSKEVVKEMMKEGYSVTKLSSYGSFLRGGINITLMCVTYAERVDNALDILRRTCKSRKYDLSQVEPASLHILQGSGQTDAAVVVGGATVFVMDVEAAYKF